jgi:Spy/CpxP family protein refolding chaperone
MNGDEARLRSTVTFNERKDDDKFDDNKERRKKCNGSNSTVQDDRQKGRGKLSELMIGEQGKELKEGGKKRREKKERGSITTTTLFIFIVV